MRGRLTFHSLNFKRYCSKVETYCSDEIDELVIAVVVFEDYIVNVMEMLQIWKFRF